LSKHSTAANKWTKERWNKAKITFTKHAKYIIGIQPIT
jgi:hypothetical protein